VLGQTGQTLVDAAMRELAATGYLGNRLRQVAASYLIHDLAVTGAPALPGLSHSCWTTTSTATRATGFTLPVGVQIRGGAALILSSKPPPTTLMEPTSV
jgi:hypothetical protein